MEGDFFGFSTLHGTVQNGNMKLMELESRGQRSSERAVGDDIDSRNDETFGEAALAEDDWEEEHEKMAVLLELEDPHLLPSDLGSAPGRKYKTRQEEALEESISHLIVEDDDDDDDDKEEEDIATLHSITAGRPIPGRKRIVDLDELLGPTSPPGLLNTEELIGGHHSIWGSPHTRELKQKQQEDSLQNLLRAMQVQHIQDTAPPVLPASAPTSSLSSVLPNALTLEEIEKDIIGGSTSSSVAVDPMQSRILAQDELLRNLAVSGQASSPVHTAGLPMPIGTPPRGQIRRQVAPSSMAAFLAQQTSGGVVSADQMAGLTSTHMSDTSSPQQQLLEQLYSGAAAAKLQQAGMRLSPTIHPLLNPDNPSLRSDHLALLDAMQGLPPGMETGAPQRAISPGTQALLRSLFDATVLPKTEAPHSEQPKVPPPDVTLVQSPRVPPVNSSTPSVHPPKLGASSTPRDMSSTPPSGGSPQMGKPMRMGGPGQNRKPPLQGPPPWRPPPEGMVPHPFRGMHMGRGGPPRHLLPYPNMHQRPCGPPPFPDPGHMRFPQGGRFMPPPPRGYFPPQYGHRPPMFMGGPRGGPPMPPHMHGPMRGGLHMMMPPRYPPPHFHNHPQGWREQEEWEGEWEGEPETEEEEYAGLMLQREKDWVIKIQLLQLQTDNPYLDDFYYTTWLMKKAAEERKQNQVTPLQSKSSEPKLVLPHLARIETKVYKPVQFENSLGRLTSSNVHSPRQIIDVHADNMHEKEPVKGHELRRLKQILLDIEKNYDLLLEVDDLEKRVLALPDHARQKLFDERRTKINELFGRLHCNANRDSQFVHMICIKKGLQLVGRFIPLLDQTEAQSLVAALFRHLTVISRKDWQAKVLVALFESIQRTVSLADLQALVKFSDELRASSTATDTQQTVVTALQNKFGSSVIWSLINRGEQIYTQVSPVDLDTDHQMAWSKFVHSVVEAIDGVSVGVLAQPQGQFTLAQRHVERLTTNQQTLANIEDKLAKVLSHPQQPS